MNNKAQTIEQAPTIILIVGLVFLLMATLAFIGDEYGDSIKTTLTGTVTNESGAYINSTGYTLDKTSVHEATGFVITTVHNASNGVVIASSNYTLSSAGVLTNATATTWSDVNVSYTYSYTERDSSYNVTEDLQTEIDDNVSIAGIVLTISLVGIVLTVLIGVFVGFRRRL